MKKSTAFFDAHFKGDHVAFEGHRVRRNPSIELFRVFLMFGIVLLHVGRFGENATCFPSNICFMCVPGFMIVSGYFGIKFKLSKVVRLYATAAACVGILYVAKLIICPEVQSQLSYGHWWFLHAYVIVMAFAPLIDMVLQGRTPRQIAVALVSLFMVVYLWGGALNYNHLRQWLPEPRGVHAYSFLTLLGVYILGRLIALFDVEKKVSIATALCWTVVLLAWTGVSRFYFIGYNNIICQLQAVFLFILFAKIKVGERIARIVSFAAPSTFAIYLIHYVIPVRDLGFEPCAFLIRMVKWCDVFDGCCRSLVLVGVALMVFAISFMMDLPRRLLVDMGMGIFCKVNMIIDSCYEKLVTCLFRQTKRLINI